MTREVGLDVLELVQQAKSSGDEVGGGYAIVPPHRPCSVVHALAAYTIRGVKGTDTPNQDAYDVKYVPAVSWSAGPVFIAGVFDGHGEDGHVVSKMVCTLLMKFVCEEAAAHQQREVFRERGLRAACERAEAALVDKKVAYESGTTAVLAVVCCEEVMLLNVGDSGVSFTLQDGTTRYVTRDHSPDDPDEHDRITAAGGYVAGSVQEESTPRVYKLNSRGKVRGGLAIARAFGDLYLRPAGVIASPDVSSYPLGLKAGSEGWHSLPVLITLASDGLWDVIDEGSVPSLLMSRGRQHVLESSVANVAGRARDAWVVDTNGSYVDDITVCMMVLDWTSVLGAGATVDIHALPSRSVRGARYARGARGGPRPSVLDDYIRRCTRDAKDCGDVVRYVMRHATIIPGRLLFADVRSVDRAGAVKGRGSA